MPLGTVSVGNVCPARMRLLNGRSVFCVPCDLLSPGHWCPTIRDSDLKTCPIRQAPGFPMGNSAPPEVPCAQGRRPPPSPLQQCGQGRPGERADGGHLSARRA